MGAAGRVAVSAKALSGFFFLRCFKRYCACSADTKPVSPAPEAGGTPNGWPPGGESWALLLPPADSVERKPMRARPSSSPSAKAKAAHSKSTSAATALDRPGREWRGTVGALHSFVWLTKVKCAWLTDPCSP